MKPDKNNILFGFFPSEGERGGKMAGRSGQLLTLDPFFLPKIGVL
jgi:hypothetical protein